MRKRRGGWTDDRIAELRRLVESGLPFSTVARMLGTTRNSAIGMARRTGITSGAERPNVNRPAKRHNDGVIAPPAPMPEPIPGGVSTLNLAPHQCKWPVSADWPWLHCGAQREGLGPYCARHREIGFQRQSIRRSA